ncbi:hypothetical protein ACPOL_0635 [Acidisarcina polymorpha]|uniref:Uncharacterized protein n=1 Tax=Acidisarcina polymorpha TaxID=2211140 RepID=A0A2Z5FU36_9BACT|nr:hypothetical protein ACPOL_0635 [Acidisarcina polymorpha]
MTVYRQKTPVKSLLRTLLTGVLVETVSVKSADLGVVHALADALTPAPRPTK